MKNAALILFALLAFGYLATRNSSTGGGVEVQGQYASGNFEAAVASNETVLVDFWASWCGPCKKMEPVIANISNDYAGKVSVYKVNVDQQPDVARKYGVIGLPTYLIFKDGQMVAREMGMISPSLLTQHF